MIDVHCHLEQKDYDKDRDTFINDLKKELRAVISVATHPEDFEKGLEIKKKHEGFVFLAAGVHPQLIQEVTKERRGEMFDKIEKNKSEVVSIGEAGLDFYWVKDSEFREMQKRYFGEDVEFARSLGKPVSVHSRGAEEETAEILVDEGYERVHWHLFRYARLVPLVVKYGWMISVGPLLLTSKTLTKIVRDVPLAQIALETDSPWWGNVHGQRVRGTPLNIKPVAQKIAEIKKQSFEEVWATCGKNATEFFRLPIRT